MSEISDYKIRAQVRRLFDSLALIVSEESVAVGILALAEVNPTRFSRGSMSKRHSAMT